MKYNYIKEPRLIFGDDNKHVCARKGIATYGVYDKSALTRKKEIMAICNLRLDEPIFYVQTV